MGLWRRNGDADEINSATGGSKDGQTDHTEKGNGTANASGFKLNRAGDGDEALNLFDSTADVHEPIDPVEEKKVVRKIDFMILPVRAWSAIDAILIANHIPGCSIWLCAMRKLYYCPRAGPMLTNIDRFFYIDKTTLSYAAIFGIEEDLDLHGAQYSWLR
jgi:hypothetical protein